MTEEKQKSVEEKKTENKKETKPENKSKENVSNKISVHDFIEVEYTGKLTDDTVFDTNDQKIAQENGIFSQQMKYEPTLICVGERQLIPGLDAALIDKEVGKSYQIELPPEDAFGKKDIKKIRLVPLADFRAKNINPQPGMQVDMDGQVATIIRASGGRIMVNFNHPLAGRPVVYDIKINKKVTDKQKQLEAYLGLALNLPGVKAEVKDDKAKVILPMELPEPILNELGKRLKEIIKLKDVSFGKLEKK
tara:strand:+ start:763 stop:1509 length:747 start_codon:yes stop_codon:yes gene_type:complete